MINSLHSRVIELPYVLILFIKRILTVLNNKKMTMLAKIYLLSDAFLIFVF